MGKKINFFKEAVLNAKTSGTIIPSSRFLAEQMTKNIDFKACRLIVELGSGDGAITKHILKKMKSNNHLICFEINDFFYNELLEINHPQLTVLNVSAENIIKEIKERGFNNADFIISCLPLSIIPEKKSKNILSKSYKALKNQGKFVQFQYTLSHYKKLKLIYKKENIALKFELRNIPPAFIYKCTKR